jgi:glycine hydroxymethyltransferase
MVVQVDGAPQASAVPDCVFDRLLGDTDPEVFEAISAEPA